MKAGTAQKISNAILSCGAGLASFLFSLGALLYLTELDQKIVAAIGAGAFCLLISYVASERPNSESARALSALSERLLAVEDGDLVSPAPPIVRRAMPKVAAAVDGNPELMLNDSTHPVEDPPKAQLWGIPTKSHSVFCPVLLISASGEHAPVPVPSAFEFESCPLAIVLDVRAILKSVGWLAPSLPQTYRFPLPPTLV